MVHNRAIPLQAGAVQIKPVLDADQIRHLHRIKHAGSMASRHAGGNILVRCSDVFERHLERRECGLAPEFPEYYARLWEVPCPL
jgi:hypothetical protein